MRPAQPQRAVRAGCGRSGARCGAGREVRPARGRGAAGEGGGEGGPGGRPGGGGEGGGGGAAGAGRSCPGRRAEVRAGGAEERFCCRRLLVWTGWLNRLAEADVIPHDNIPPSHQPGWLEQM